MDSGKLVEYCLTKLIDALLLFALVSLTLLQCCPPKKTPRPPPQMKYDARSPTITNSRSRSHSVDGSPGKSPMSPSPSKRSSTSRASKHRKSAEDRKHKKKTKHKKKKSAESAGKKDESRRSSRREKDEVLPVQSTQPTLPSSSDPDSVGTARIEMITFPIAESPKKPPPPIPQFKKASHEQASAEKKSKEFPATKKQSVEILPDGGRRQSRETMRDPFAVQMKQSKECERVNSASGSREVAKNQITSKVGH